MKKTPWFPARIAPVRAGEYEVIRNGVSPPYPQRTRLKWKGRKWVHTRHSSNNEFVGGTADMSELEGDRWRGLAEPPK